jgi:hypothetical protein
LEADSILERAKDLSPARIIETKRVRTDDEDEEAMPAPFLGSRITKSGEVQAPVTPVPRTTGQRMPRPKPKPKPKPETCSTEATEAVAKKLGIDSKNVPRQIVLMYELIMSGKESEINTKKGPRSIREAAMALKKVDPTVTIYEHSRCRKKEDLIALFRDKFK